MLFSHFLLLFHIFSFFISLREGLEHGANKQKTVRRVRSPYELFRFPIAGLLFFLSFLPAALAGRKPHSPPVRQRRRIRPSFLFSDQRERETKIFFGQRKKKEGFFFGWVKRDLLRAKRKLGSILGKAGISFLVRDGVFVWIIFHFLFILSFSILYFRARRPGEKTTDITASNRGKRLGCREGWIREPVIRASFFFFWWTGIGFWSLGFGWNRLLIWATWDGQRGKLLREQ